MKTLFKTISLFVCIMFAMQSQAQTKEETVSWLQETLILNMVTVPSYGDDYFKDIRLESIDECKIVLSFYYLGNKIKETLPIAEIKIDENGFFIYNADVTYIMFQNEKEYSSHSTLPFHSKDQKLREKVEQAMKHLSTFCDKQ